MDVTSKIHIESIVKNFISLIVLIISFICLISVDFNSKEFILSVLSLILFMPIHIIFIVESCDTKKHVFEFNVDEEYLYLYRKKVLKYKIKFCDLKPIKEIRDSRRAPIRVKFIDKDKEDFIYVSDKNLIRILKRNKILQ